MGDKMDKDVQEWALSKDCSDAVADKAAKVLNKFLLRELKEWMKSDLAVFAMFCKQELKLEGAEILDFSSALRDTEW